MTNRRNTCIFEGNLVADPRFRTFLKKQDGQTDKEVAVVDFTLAADGGRNGQSNETFFGKFQAFDKGAERLREFKKGEKLHVECVARNNEWTDGEGQKRREVVFRVTHFIPIYVRDMNNDTE